MGGRGGLCTFFYHQPWNLSLLYMCVVCLCGRVPSGVGGGEEEGEKIRSPCVYEAGFFFFLKKTRRGGNLTSDLSVLQLNQRSQT